MTVAPAMLRLQFPEFSDSGAFPDPLINSWVATAAGMLDPTRWGALLDYGTMLFVCHRLALQRRAVLAAGFGGVPGQASGPVSSKSVDKVSQSYDTATASEEGAGFWNLTVYGQEYIRQARMVGAGPLTVNSDDSALAGPGGLAAYAGPGWGAPWAY